MIRILPALSEQNGPALLEKLNSVSGLCDWVHIDYSDGSIVPNVSAPLPDFPHAYPTLQAQLSLLSMKPETLIQTVMKSGVRRVIAPVEAHSPREFLEEARTYDCEIGLSMDIETPIEDIEPFLEEIDTVLVNTAPMGVAGQPFEDHGLATIKAIHRNFPDLPILVKGGIDEESIKEVKEAGASGVISQSYLFRDPHHIREALLRLEETAG